MTSSFPRAASVALAMLVGAGFVAPLPVVAAQKAIPAEHNPPGDIPDSQVFITYQGSSFTMKVPEGWSRRDETNGAVFSDKYNVVEVTASGSNTAPTVKSADNSVVKDLEALDRAVKVESVKPIKLDGGQAIRIDYAINSEPNPVTNKQIRLEDVRFLVFNNRTLVTLDMAAPYGADNVDQWNLMSNSIRIQ